MKKVLKTVLFISDDFGDEEDWKDAKDDCEPGNYFYGKENNWLKFKFDIVKSFENITSTDYDAIMIDYGLVGGEENMKFLSQLYRKGKPMAWIGGMPRCYLVDDFEKLFPNYPFASALHVGGIGTDDVLWILYDLFKHEEPPQ